MLRRFALLSALLLVAACGGVRPVTPTAPAAPTNVTAAPGPGYVTLTWQDNSADETGFVIYRDPGPSAGLRVQAEAKLADVAANVMEYLDRDTQIGVEYRYRVAAKNAQGESAGSAESQDEATVGVGVDLMVGTNNRRYSETDNGTIFVVYFLFPEAVLADESVIFEGSITGPAGWNGGAPLTFSRPHFARMRGFTVLSHNAITAVAGTYTLSLTAGDDSYTATDTLADAAFKLPRPTNLRVTEHSASQVTVTWTPPAGSVYTSLRLYRGEYEELLKGGGTNETTFTFSELELAPGLYSVEVAPFNVDFVAYPIRTEPFGLSYDTVNFVVGGGVAPQCSSPAQVVAIPDANLQQAIRETLNKPTGDLTCEDMARLTQLDARERGIGSLAGLEYAVNLRDLEKLDGNTISDLSPLAGLTELRALSLDRNQITDISPLAGLTKLNWLWLGGNTISDISVYANFAELRGTSLWGNPVGSLEPLRTLTGLEQLYLSDPVPVDIEIIRTMSGLERLSLVRLGLTNMSFVADLPLLTHLDLGGNQISDLSPLANLTNLKELRLWGQPLGGITPLTSLTGLTLLDLGGTGVTDIGFLSALTGLERLWLWGNGLSDISPLAELINLRYLDLYDNDLGSISALVANSGFGSGDEVNLINNRLDLTPGSATRNDVQALQNRGVTVRFEPQQTP